MQLFAIHASTRALFIRVLVERKVTLEQALADKMLPPSRLNDNIFASIGQRRRDKINQGRAGMLEGMMV